MRHFLRSPSLQATSLLLVLSLQGAPAPTARALHVPPQAESRHGLPGERPGTERWLVTFKTRSFELTELRAAHLGREATAAGVASIVRGLEDAARADQRDFAAFVEQLGGDVRAQWWLINGCAVEVPAGAVAALRAHARVLRIDPDERVAPASPFIGDSTNSSNHGSDLVTSQGFTGKGVTVAIMDTGVDHPMGSTLRPHRAFFVNGDPTDTTGGGIAGSRLVKHQSFGLLPTPDDDNSHGTAVAAVAAGQVWANPASDAGHAPGAWIGSYKIADDLSGRASYQSIISAWQAIAADAKQLGIVAANNSYYGSPDPTHPSQQALDSVALNADVLPVCAAGNDDVSTIASQSVANGLAVGACHNLGQKTVTQFSSRGPLNGDPLRFYPDLCANGFRAVTPLRDDESGYYLFSGTSCASPQVCGAATWFRALVPAADTMQARAAILDHDRGRRQAEQHASLRHAQRLRPRLPAR